MPINKFALIRYKTIDNCLQNHSKKWTLDDLVEACSEALYEYEGISRGISKRAIQLDIQNMRSKKLGYNAPILVSEKKYYSYSDRNYSIANNPLTEQDLHTLTEVLGVLTQFKGFGYFEELYTTVTKLEDKLFKQTHKGKSYIDFEKNDLLKGIKHIDPLHKTIINKRTLKITYQSFKALIPQEIIFYPFLLKEYRNRWFLLGANRRGKETMILALDRIENFCELPTEKYVKASFDVSTYFDDALGVSKIPGQKAHRVVIKISNAHAPYIITKPVHHTQKILKKDNDGVIFSIDVIWNFELEREILGFGEHVKVLSPKRIKNKIGSRINQMLLTYKLDENQTS